MVTDPSVRRPSPAVSPRQRSHRRLRRHAWFRSENSSVTITTRLISSGRESGPFETPTVQHQADGRGTLRQPLDHRLRHRPFAAPAWG